MVMAIGRPWIWQTLTGVVQTTQGEWQPSSTCRKVVQNDTEITVLVKKAVQLAKSDSRTVIKVALG